ncbi:MAG: hypothetical protein HN403_04520 [Rhodospirillales bacterium]|jgi:flagellar biosynthesis activator protein FlaF|nr:hypothetical protein [Rhodospirillales bacterium]
MAYENQPPGPGYGTVPQGGMPQYTEAWALVEAARRMAEATLAKDSKTAMRDALRLNWRLWTIFQAELTAGTSNVSEEVRMNMLTLCKYIDQHTVDAIPFPTEEKIAVLVEINRNIANGMLESLNKATKEAAEAAGIDPTETDVPPPADAPTSFDEEV